MTDPMLPKNIDEIPLIFFERIQHLTKKSITPSVPAGVSTKPQQVFDYLEVDYLR